MASSYNLASGNEAWYTTTANGETQIKVRSTAPLKPRAIYVGTATLNFRWISTGKSTQWQFTPTLVNPSPADFTVTDEGNGQVTTVEFGKRMFPATGIIQPNAVGEIRAPAVQFDIPYAHDLWIFPLRSPWFPLKIAVEKTPLTISHGSAQAMADVATSPFDEGKSLRINASVHGEGLERVWVSLKRRLGSVKIEETLGEVKDGLGAFSWKPVTANFDVVLVTWSNMQLGGFIDFLKFMGADAKKSFWGGYLAGCLSTNFLLSDSPTMNYELILKGEKHLLGHEEDSTKITLTP